MSAKLASLSLFLLLGACGGDDESSKRPPSEHAYILGSLVFGEDSSTSYVSVLDTLDAQTVDFKQAHEFSGASDVWVHNGAVFVADAEPVTISKYAVDGHDLVKQETIGLSQYGITDFGFWRNVFVSEDKAYFINGTSELIVWNPTTMLITGTVALPALGERDGLTPFAGYSDRAALVRGGRLYQPIYFTDPETYFAYTQESLILVIDIATDTVVDTLTAPCPGLDYASADAAGNMYFSSWIYAAGAATVLDQPATCVYEIPANGSPAVVSAFADMDQGHEGAALRLLPDGRTLFSALHDEHVAAAEPTVEDVTFGSNWRFWTSASPGAPATLVDAIDWSSGAHYSSEIDGKSFMLIADGDYGATTVYQLSGTGITPTPMFSTTGWSLRLFKVR